MANVRDPPFCAEISPKPIEASTAQILTFCTCLS
jgi:hypothetical protein